jgi:hypothetical protein
MYATLKKYIYSSFQLGAIQDVVEAQGKSAPTLWYTNSKIAVISEK